MNALVILTRGYKEEHKYNSLLKRNKQLEIYYNKNIDYIIFHEGNISEEHQKYINNETIIPFKFINVEKEFKIKDENLKFRHKTFQWGMGYRNMCNFWFCGFWKYVEKYDKILRIDEDCLIYYDYNKIFLLLNNKVACYGKWMPFDSYKVTKGLNKFTVDFLKSNNKIVKPKKCNGPYTNIIGFNLNLLRCHKLLNKYIKEVYKSNQIYISRWGDLPLWGDVLFYLFKKHHYIEIKDLKYTHDNLKINM